MKGSCMRCGLQTMTCRGSEDRASRGKPQFGYRLGYAVERGDRTVLLCAPCLVNSLPSGVAA